MARYTDGNRRKIDETVERWRERCLLADGSLLLDDRDGTWAIAAIDELHRRFNENQLVGQVAGGTFLTKWDEQLSGAEDDVRLLAAEILLVHFLFAFSVGKAAKLNLVRKTLGDSGIELPGDENAAIAAMGESIGHPGIGFNTRRDVQVAYLIDFGRRLKQLDPGDRSRLLGEPWELRDFADNTEEPVREMRHIILHLLRPDEFERISSGTHKREIAAAFAGLLEDGAPEDVDERLLQIRQSLEEFLPEGNASGGAIDFYHAPLHGVWESTAAEGEGAGDVEALGWKKQIVLYGPPGTSKTFEARQLAETLIRRAALERWGPARFFGDLDDVERLVEENLFWVQLHPGYGYEEFIRGMRLEGDVTRYQPGVLPHIVKYAGEQTLPPDVDPLPIVLVLDEINRTDLSALFGEAFSLLERDQRGKSVPLPGVNPDEPPDRLALPEDLYVIGTMNEIDQSVETLDFALRRRFLWRECPFERDTLLTIVASRWSEDVPRRFKYSDAEDQLDRFADRARELNEAIEESEELGRAYHVGHTYFADITFFLGSWLAGRKQKPQNNCFLWKSRGAPQPPLEDIWSRSLKPLLEQYLAGSDVRDDELRRLKDTFFRP